MTLPTGAPGAPIRLEAAAGGRGGSWYVLLEGIAQLVGEIHPGLAITVIEGGGVANHARVGAGEIPLAILNPPMLAAAQAGRDPFDRAYPDLRVIAAGLTWNHLHVAVDRAVPIGTLAEWRERHLPLRIPVDRIGTVDRLVFDLTLDHLGIGPDDPAAWGGALIPAQNYDEQQALYESGAANALWQFMGIPSPSIVAAVAARPFRLLPLPEPLIGRLIDLGWSAGTIPAGAYGVAAKPVPTVSMGTTLGCHASVPQEVVAAITGVLCDHVDRVRAIHPAATDFDPAGAARGGGAPLHAGAERAYRERGLLGA